MLLHAPEPTAALCSTSGSPCGLQPTASHTGGMVSPFFGSCGKGSHDPRFHFFCKWDPRSSTLQVQAVKAGITAINGVLTSCQCSWARSLCSFTFPPASSVPPPYGQEGING